MCNFWCISYNIAYFWRIHFLLEIILLKWRCNGYDYIYLASSKSWNHNTAFLNHCSLLPSKFYQKFHMLFMPHPLPMILICARLVSNLNLTHKSVLPLIVCQKLFNRTLIFFNTKIWIKCQCKLIYDSIYPRLIICRQYHKNINKNGKL